MINYFKIKKILAKDTLPIRQLVLRDGKIPIKHCQFEDDNNPFSFHLGAIKENKIIGIISILNQSSSISKIKRLRGMAVLEGYRKIGVGSNLIIEAEKILQNSKTNLIWLNAREKALSFYLKNGFKMINDPFTIENIGIHYKCEKKIK